MSSTRPAARSRLLDAALAVIRQRGYAGTTIDDVCQRAGVTKGSFFHHFKSKDELALAAAAHFSSGAAQLFADAPYQRAKDPRDRLLGYVDFRAAILAGELHEYTCLLGTMVQEVHATHPQIRAACAEDLAEHIAGIARDIAEAKARYAPEAAWSAESVGYFVQSVLQGSFIFAKAKQGPEVIRESLAHLRRYLEMLFPRSAKEIRS